MWVNKTLLPSAVAPALSHPSKLSSTADISLLVYGTNGFFQCLIEHWTDVSTCLRTIYTQSPIHTAHLLYLQGKQQWGGITTTWCPERRTTSAPTTAACGQLSWTQRTSTTTNQMTPSSSGQAECWQLSGRWQEKELDDQPYNSWPQGRAWTFCLFCQVVKGLKYTVDLEISRTVCRKRAAVNLTSCDFQPAGKLNQVSASRGHLLPEWTIWYQPLPSWLFRYCGATLTFG